MVDVSSVIDFLIRQIPGYDYRVKKNRLNTDRSVRDKLSRELKKTALTLKEVSDLAYKDGRRDVVDHIKDLLKTIDLFVKEIEAAPFGQSPLFKEDDVGQGNIEKMIQFDRQLITSLEVITTTADLVYENVLKGNTADIILNVRKVKKEIDSMRNTFTDRLDFFMKK
jgi:hypothetical protein